MSREASSVNESQGIKTVEDTYLGKGREKGGESDSGDLHIDDVVWSDSWSVISQRKTKSDG